MRTDLMSPIEVERASMNLRGIEHSLGHRVSYGVVDATELGGRLYSPIESEYVATNIRNIEGARGRGPSTLQTLVNLGFLGSVLVYTIFVILVAIF